VASRLPFLKAGERTITRLRRRIGSFAGGAGLGEPLCDETFSYGQIMSQTPPLRADEYLLDPRKHECEIVLVYFLERFEQPFRFRILPGALLILGMGNDRDLPPSVPDPMSEIFVDLLRWAVE
jgi:hypothetical protein